MILKFSIHQGDITLINIYIPENRNQKYTQQKHNLKEKGILL